MERLTQINGNNEIYCIVDDKKIAVENIDILKICQRLKLYEDLDEQSLLLRLPCKVGDRLYKIDYDYLGNIISDTVHSIHILRNTVYLEMKYWHDISLSEVGKTIFLTQAEAEQKLKEVEA